MLTNAWMMSQIFCKLLAAKTSNLSKAHVTHDNIGPATGNQRTSCNKIITSLEQVPKFEASVRKTP